MYANYSNNAFTGRMIFLLPNQKHYSIEGICTINTKKNMINGTKWPFKLPKITHSVWMFQM